MSELTFCALPKHVAIIMDGNGRWAKEHSLPRERGHKAGFEAAREIVRYCAEQGIEVLTLFVFSSENWRRPQNEVDHILALFLLALEKEIDDLNKNNIQLRVIGDLSKFPPELQKSIQNTQELTRENSGLKLVLAANYGGCWDIVQAARKLAQQVVEGKLTVEQITETKLEEKLSLAGLPPPDLFIRTSGEQRISNFYLWQLSYCELYFTDTYWPDFNREAMRQALDFFASRERRFGYTGEQIDNSSHGRDKE